MKRFFVLVLVGIWLMLMFGESRVIDQLFCPGKNYTPQNPCIVLNPYRKTPLTALIQFRTKKPAQITLQIQGKNGAAPLKTTFKPFVKKHIIPVFGLYPNYENTVFLTITYEDNSTQTLSFSIQTEPLTNHFSSQVTRKEDSQTHYYWLTSGDVIDEQGETRFSFKDEYQNHYLFNNQIVSEDRIGGLKVHSLLGKKIKTYKYPKGFTSFTHGIGQTENGNFLVIGSMKGKSIFIQDKKVLSQREFVIEIDKKSGKVVKTVDLAELLYPNRSVIVPEGVLDFGMSDWCHINGVDYDKMDQSWVVSCRHHGFFKITKDGKLDWLVTPKRGLEHSGRDGKGPALWDKVLTAVDLNGNVLPQAVQEGTASSPDFKWPTRNHSVFVADENIYTLYDNSGKVNDPAVFTTKNSYAAVFKVDPQKRTIQEIWKEDLKQTSHVGSNVFWEPAKNAVLVYSSSLPSAKEGFACGELVRYELSTHRPKFSVLIMSPNSRWIFWATPFQFYSEEG